MTLLLAAAIGYLMGGWTGSAWGIIGGTGAMLFNAWELSEWNKLPAWWRQG